MQSLHQTQLRPSLGHPHNRTEMDTLCSSEERRRQEALDGAKQHAEALAVGLSFKSGLIGACKLNSICNPCYSEQDTVLALLFNILKDSRFTARCKLVVV